MISLITRKSAALGSCEMREARLLWSPVPRVAAARDEGVLILLILAAQRDVAVAQLGEQIVEVLLGRGGRLHADRDPIHIGGREDAGVGMHGEALTGVEGGRGKVDAAPGVALRGHRGGADQHIDLLCGEQLEAAGRGDRQVLDGIRVFQHRGGDRLAELDIKAGERAVGLEVAEAGLRAFHAAVQDPAVDHVPQHALGVHSRRRPDRPRRLRRRPPAASG